MTTNDPWENMNEYISTVTCSVDKSVTTKLFLIKIYETNDNLHTQYFQIAQHAANKIYFHYI